VSAVGILVLIELIASIVILRRRHLTVRKRHDMRNEMIEAINAEREARAADELAEYTASLGKNSQSADAGVDATAAPAVETLDGSGEAAAPSMPKLARKQTIFNAAIGELLAVCTPGDEAVPAKNKPALARRNSIFSAPASVKPAAKVNNWTVNALAPPLGRASSIVLAPVVIPPYLLPRNAARVAPLPGVIGASADTGLAPSTASTDLPQRHSHAHLPSVIVARTNSTDAASATTEKPASISSQFMPPSLWAAKRSVAPADDATASPSAIVAIAASMPASPMIGAEKMMITASGFDAFSDTTAINGAKSLMTVADDADSSSATASKYAVDKADSASIASVKAEAESDSDSVVQAGASVLGGLLCGLLDPSAAAAYIVPSTVDSQVCLVPAMQHLAL
jgi:hypothetical protein